MKNKKAFTLIELIAVLVILAILALIVTPIVLNIVKNAKKSADKRSVDGYGKSIENAIADYFMDNSKKPNDISDLNINYSGNKVDCGIFIINNDTSIYLSECSVNGKNVIDENSSDGYYHYGKIKNSIEDDDIVYKAYKIGDEVTYNKTKFYVIANSNKSSDSVTLLKEEPLTVAEVNKYGGVGTENNHVNKYTKNSTGTAFNINGYGGMAYYSSSTCGYNGSNWIFDGYYGCTIDYAKSDVKYVVDAWALDKLGDALKEDSGGYKARLITYDELIDNLGYEIKFYCSVDTLYTGTLDSVPTWVYNNKYSYWTMSIYESSLRDLLYVQEDGKIASNGSYSTNNITLTIRPVVTLSKNKIK